MIATFIRTVVLLAIVGLPSATEARAEPGYGAIGPALGCPPVFVTQFKQVFQDIPVHHTVYKTEVIPTEVYVPQFEQVYKTIVRNHFLPEYVTTTRFVDQVQIITDLRYVTETDVQNLVVTETQVVPNFVTNTVFNTVFRTNVDYRTSYRTEVLPTYLTTNEVRFETQYLTNIVPEYSTLYRTVHNVKTVCPKPAYGY